MTNDINIGIDVDLDDLGASVRPIPWADFKARVAEMWNEHTCSAAYAKMFLWALRCLESIDLADEGGPRRTIASTSDLTLRLVRRYVAAQPATLSPHTLRGRLSALRSMCTFAFEHRWLAVNPFALRPMRRWVKLGRPSGKRHLTRDECRRLLEVLRGDVETRKGWALWQAHRLLVAVEVALWCGLRRNELLRLQVGDVDLGGRLIHVRPHGKTLKTERSEDSVPIPEAIVPHLEEWLSRWRLACPVGFPIPADCPWVLPTARRRSPWVSGSPQSKATYLLKVAGKRAGIEHIHWQMLRRTCATLLAARGVGGALVAQILRHSEAVDERFYRGRDEQALKDAARDLDI